MLLRYKFISYWRFVPEKNQANQVYHSAWRTKIAAQNETANSCESSTGVRITNSQQLLKHFPHVY